VSLQTRTRPSVQTKLDRTSCGLRLRGETLAECEKKSHGTDPINLESRPDIFEIFEVMSSYSSQRTHTNVLRLKQVESQVET
jgi:hypothetical protein